MEPMTEVSGRCLCGAVRYVVQGALRPVSYCHCSQCRRTSGHFVAATACDAADLHLLNDAGLRWYRSSPRARRGFCGECGSSLFWEPDHGQHVSIMAGTMDRPTGLRADEHIFVADASDYYVLADGLPQFEHYSPGTRDA
jgi:hypothetical protein